MRTVQFLTLLMTVPSIVVATTVPLYGLWAMAPLAVSFVSLVVLLVHDLRTAP